MQTVVNQINGKAIEESSEKLYEQDAKNGFCTFFDFGNLRFGEASCYTKEDNNEVLEDTITYYIMDFSLFAEMPLYYRVSETVMTEILKIKFCYNPEATHELLFELLAKHGIIID